jgi:hypothetical protein
MMLVEGEAISVFTETVAAELWVLVNYRKYVVAITRDAAGTATIQAEAHRAAEQ